MGGLMLKIFFAGLFAYLFLIMIFGYIDTFEEDDLPEGCTRDGDCPCCEHSTIMYQNSEETEVKYWCTKCDWMVSFHKDEDGMWRKK